MTPEEALTRLQVAAEARWFPETADQEVNVLRELVESAGHARVVCRACGHANRVIGDHVETWEHPVISSGVKAGANPAARQVGESYREYGDRLYGMYRALLVDVERLRKIERAARAWQDAPSDDSATQDALLDLLDGR